MTPKQRDDLRKHLENALTNMQCTQVIKKLDQALTSYTEWARPTAAADVPRLKKFQKYTKRVRALVAELRELLDEPVAYLPRKFDRRPLLKALDELDAVASAREKEIPLRKGSGGRYKNWAKELFIKNVYEAYPRGQAKKRDQSNFELTVEKLLGFVNEPTNDIHSLIMRALAPKSKARKEQAQ